MLLEQSGKISTTSSPALREELRDDRGCWFRKPIQPGRCGRQRHRVNAPADDMETYYKRNKAIPLIDERFLTLDNCWLQTPCTFLQP